MDVIKRRPLLKSGGVTYIERSRGVGFAVAEKQRPDDSWQIQRISTQKGEGIARVDRKIGLREEKIREEKKDRGKTPRSGNPLPKGPCVRTLVRHPNKVFGGDENGRAVEAVRGLSAGGGAEARSIDPAEARKRTSI